MMLGQDGVKEKQRGKKMHFFQLNNKKWNTLFVLFGYNIKMFIKVKWDLSYLVELHQECH